MAKGFCVCHRTTADPQYLPAPGASWHYLCDKPTLPCRTCGFHHPESDCPRWPAREPERVIHDCDPAAGTCYCGEPGEAQRIAEVFEDARAEMDRGL